jgi:hypothetical protein
MENVSAMARPGDASRKSPRSMNRKMFMEFS